MSEQPTPQDSQATTAPAPEEKHRIKAFEIILFLILGVVPISLLYAFATQGVQDEAGQRFELERRQLMASCMDQLDDRKECREQVDGQVMTCYEQLNLPDKAKSPIDRPALARCVSRQDDGAFKVRSKAQQEADAQAKEDAKKTPKRAPKR